MGRNANLVVIVLGLWLAGCATSFEVVQLPERSADLYPLAHTANELTVAVDEIRDPERAHRYFGVDLLAHDVLPVNVVVSNHQQRPVVVKPADVMLHRDNEIIDPLPVSRVAALAKSSRRLDRDTRKQVDAYYRDVTFKRTVVAPNDTYQGVMFFRVAGPEARDEGMFRRVALWMQSGMQLDVVVETADEHERLRFGPFGLSGPSRSAWF